MSSRTSNPFHLPEIRSRVAQFVSVQTSLSCVQVSKAFAQDFVAPIWHTINFKTHKKFANLDPATLRKNGHHVRVAKNIRNKEQVDSLQSLGSCKLSSLTIAATTDAVFLASCLDMIRRNHMTLTELSFGNANGRMRTTSPFIFLDSLTSMTSSTSKLTRLSIQWLIMTRATLSSVLRCSPALTDIDLWGTTLTDGGIFDDYQHVGVEFLQAMAEDVVKVGTPSLLVHFPNLQRWGTGSKLPLSEFPTQAVKNCVSKWCSKLSEIETISTPSILLCHLLVNVFTGLTTFVFEYDDISSDMIMAVLRYPTSWTTIATYTPRDGFYEDFAEDGVYDDPDHFQSSGWMIQSLLRICYKLKIFNVHQHVMDLDDIEREPWACTDLEDIAFRIRGLDTRDKIERAILMWREARGKRDQDLTDALDKDQSIEARVARHLLRFDNLHTVWLGSKLWEMPKIIVH